MTLPGSGTRVRAKRLGWDGSLDASPDLEPYHHEDDDLEGVLEVRTVGGDDVTQEYEQVLVDGHDADPATVEPLDQKI